MSSLSAFRAARLPLQALALSLVALCACDPDVSDGLGPLVPVPNILGTVLRDGAPADDLDVEIRDALSAETYADTVTEFDGAFAFADVPPGLWEVKISGDDAGDFDSVSRELLLEDDAGPLTMPESDIFAYGSHVMAPEADAVTPTPSFGQPLTFRWELPDRPLDWARVKLYDELGGAVWSSSKDPVSEVMWNGLGNEGDYVGYFIPPGDYSWRVKLSFPDGQEARLDLRNIHFEELNRTGKAGTSWRW